MSSNLKMTKNGRDTNLQQMLPYYVSSKKNIYVFIIYVKILNELSKNENLRREFRRDSNTRDSKKL